MQSLPAHVSFRMHAVCMEKCECNGYFAVGGASRRAVAAHSATLRGRPLRGRHDFLVPTVGIILHWQRIALDAVYASAH